MAEHSRYNVSGEEACMAGMQKDYAKMQRILSRGLAKVKLGVRK